MANRVMVVDDDPGIRALVTAVLEHAGIPIVAVGSGKECLAELQNGFRGVLFMDVMMPGLSGWQTLQKIRDNGWLDRVIVCMLTAVEDPDPALDSLKELVVDYLRKPIHPDAIEKAAREYLDLCGPEDAPR